MATISYDLALAQHEATAQRLSALRKALDLKQTEIAAQTGIPRPYLSEMENGKKGISRNTAASLSATYGVSIAWLLTGEGEMFPGRNDKPPDASTPVQPRAPDDNAALLATIQTLTDLVRDLREDNNRLREELRKRTT